MIVIPAIDLMGGKCVRLVKGRKEDAIVYGRDPLALADEYSSAGARIIHVVDLDGAFTGEMKNLEIIRELASRFPIQVGGGVRSEERIAELLACGARKVIVSSILFGKPELAERIKGSYAGSLIGSLDFREGKLAYAGWLKKSGRSFEEISTGLNEIIVSCADCDGTFSGPDLGLLTDIRRRFAGRMISAGGVGRSADLEALKRIGMDGAIVGRAFLENRVRVTNAKFEI